MNRKLLLVVLAVLAVVRAEADAEADHDADTPLRQAQRAMLSEREAATAKHASEDVLGMRLQAVYPEKEQPHARRISGAAQSFLPNDKMCVMCQFLAQRIQLDLVGGVHAPMYGAYGGAYGGLATSVIAGVSPVASAFVETEDVAGDEDLIEVDDAEMEADEDENEAADEEEVEGEDEFDAEAEAEADEEDAVFLEVAEEDEDEAADEEEAEDEAEDEADSEEEEAALIQVAGADEGEDWQAPEYSDAAAAAPAPVALIESEADDFQTPKYIDGVYHTVEGEEADAQTEEEADEADAGTADASEPSFFESSALVSRAADEGEWVTPEFPAVSAAPAADTVEAELTALLAVAETLVDKQDVAWTTPTYSDAQQSTGNKAYARIVATANADAEEETAEEPALLEAAAEETTAQTQAQAQQTEVKLFAPRIIRSKASRWGGRFRSRPAQIARYRSQGADLFHTAKRYRAADATVARPRWNRHEPHSPRHLSQRLLAGMALRNAEHAAYDRLEQYCSSRLPEAYGKYCRPVLRKFRRITEGLSYGDRIPHVCMRVNLCKASSYVVASPHDRLEERTF